MDSGRFIDAAQVVLTGYDAALSRQWREEERGWRAADLDWRASERGFMALDRRFMCAPPLAPPGAALARRPAWRRGRRRVRAAPLWPPPPPPAL